MKMNVPVVIHCVNSVSSLGGGVSFALKQLCEGVSGVSHEIFSLIDGAPSIISDDIAVNRYHRVGPYSLSFSRELEYNLYKRLLELDDPVVHVHGLWSGLSYSIIRIKKKLPNLKIIVSPHGMLSANALARKKYIKLFMRVISENKLIDSAFALHALIDKEFYDIEKFSKNRNIVKIPNLYEFVASCDEVKSIWMHKKFDSKRLLYLGRVHETKGIFLLIKKIIEKYNSNQPPEFKLIVAGFGDDVSVRKLNDLIGLCGGFVEYIGPVFGGDKIGTIKNVHGMILPSMTEGFPISLLEGASYGLPLFVTDECNFGWVGAVDHRCQNPYGEKGISDLVENFNEMGFDELAKLGMECYEYCRLNFDKSLISDRWRLLYSGHKFSV